MTWWLPQVPVAAQSVLRRRNSLFKVSPERRKSDFYPTPPEAVIALLKYGALRSFPKTVWEPACGDGRISRVLSSAGYSVVSTDLNAYDGFSHESEVNFLECRERRAAAIVTNPPFSIAAEFIQTARALEIGQMAMLLKIDYFSAATRLGLFRSWRPKYVLVLSWRLDFTGDGAPPMNVAWVVWDGPAEMTTFDVLERP